MAGRPRTRMRRNGDGKYVVSTLYASKAGRNFVIMPHTFVHDIASMPAFIERQIRERSFPLIVEPAVMSHDGWGYMQHTIDQGHKAAQIAAAFFSPDPIYKSAEACLDAITQQFFFLPIDPDLKVEIGEAMDRIGRSRMTPNASPETAWAIIVAYPERILGAWIIEFSVRLAHAQSVKIHANLQKQEGGIFAWARKYDRYTTGARAAAEREAEEKCDRLREAFSHTRFDSKRETEQQIRDYWWTFDDQFQGMALWEAIDRGEL